MPSTTIHFQDNLLADIDRVAADLEISRNRFVIEACKTALAQHNGVWPEDFFSTDLTVADQKLLTEAADEIVTTIFRGRKNRGAALL
jgi:metal-responsive CopG/Arc/MetJ family transcriptional regulator